MAKAAVATKPPEIPVVPDDRTEVIQAVTTDPSLALRHPVWFDAYYAALSADVAEHVPNVLTETGRDQIKALAFRVVKARTGIEGERKRATDNWRKLTTSVNAAGAILREKLEALEAVARKPLVEWQAKEDARKADIDQAIQGLRDSGTVTFDDTAASVAERLAQVRGINDLSAERFGDRQDEAQNWYDQAVSALTTAHARLLKSEAEAKELADLRERQAEADRQAAADQMAAARAENERRLTEAAAERGRLEAEQKAQARLALMDAQAEAARLKTEREAQERVDAAERALQAERAQRERERLNQEAEDQARQEREQDETHRRTINGAIRDALMTLGLDDKIARKVVTGLVKGVIPHVTVNY